VRDQGYCVRVVRAWECRSTLFLKDGQITVQGPKYDNGNSVLAITGGTGAYSDCSGEMELQFRDTSKEYLLIYRINEDVLSDRQVIVIVTVSVCTLGLAVVIYLFYRAVYHRTRSRSLLESGQPIVRYGMDDGDE